MKTDLKGEFTKTEYNLAEGGGIPCGGQEKGEATRVL